MSWAVGYDTTWNRDIGYGVPSVCDYPDCDASIDRGLSFVCGEEPYGGEYGCGLFFCDKHIGTTWGYGDVRVACNQHGGIKPSADTVEWITHKLTDDSWQQWREENLAEVSALRAAS